MIEDMIGESMPFSFSEEVRAKSLYTYGIGIYETFKDMENATLGDLEIALGAMGLVEKLSELIGLEPEQIRASKLTSLPNDIANSFTVGRLFALLEITPPDLPLFENEEFLNTPILTAFENFTAFTIGDIIRIETEGENKSNPILIKLKDITINDLSNDMDNIMNNFKIDELTVIVTDEDAEAHRQAYIDQWGALNSGPGFTPLDPSTKILQTFKRNEVTLGDLMNDLDGIFQSITMKDLTVIITPEDIAEDEAAYLLLHGNLIGYTPREVSSPLMLNIKDVTLGELMNDMGGIINDLRLCDVIAIDENSNGALYALKDIKIGELGGSETDDAIKNLKISALIDIDDNSTEILKYFRDNDTTIAGIDQALKKIQIKDVIAIDETSSRLMQSIKFAALSSYIDDNGTPDDFSDDYEVLGIDQTIQALTLSQMIDVVTDGDVAAHEQDYLNTHGDLIGYVPLTPSSRIMQSLANSTLNTLDTSIKTLKLGEMINITPSSSKFLQALQYCPLETYIDDNGTPGDPSDDVTYIGIDEKLQSTPLSDLVDVGSSHIWAFLGDKTLGNLGLAVDDMTLGDVVLIITDEPVNPGDPEKSHALLVALKDSRVSEIGTDLPDALDDCLLSELITIDASSPAILRALADKNVKVGGLGDAIADLSVEDVYPDNTTGVLSLIDGSTKIDDLPDALTNALTTKTLGELEAAGIITGVNPSIAHWTLQQLVDNANLFAP